MLAMLLLPVAPLVAPAAEPAPPAAVPRAVGSQVSVDESRQRATVRVDEGGDLDSYKDGVIGFELDMRGFAAVATTTPLLRMRVFDVDEQGGNNCAPEVDVVRVNGREVGTLSGHTDSWSTNTFPLPNGVITPQVNAFQVTVDAAGTDCWLVEVDWAEVEFGFAIAQTAAEVTRDTTIRRGLSNDVIPDKVFATGFTPTGALTAPSADDPIADSMTSGSFTYTYSLGAWPVTPTWIPEVQARWTIVSSGGTVQSGAEREVVAWNGTVEVPVPQETGKAVLRIELAISKDGRLLHTETRTHSVYVLLDNPVTSPFRTEVPKTGWLDKAFEWGAAGKTKPEQVVYDLTLGVHRQHPGWIYHGDPKLLQEPTALLEGTGDKGQCFTFAKVWQILALSLGIPAGLRDYNGNGRGFMLKPEARSLDNNRGVSAGPVGRPADRWMFASHTWGVYGGQRYDPTFGVVGDASTEAFDRQNVFCKVDAAKDMCTEVANPGRTYRLGGGTVRNATGWALVTFEPVGPAPRTAPVTALAVEGTDTGVDLDANGQWDFLRAEVPIAAPAGTYTVDARLLDSGGGAIARGRVDPEAVVNPAPTTTLDGGPATIHFPGAPIRRSGVDGPFTVLVRLFTTDGTEVAAATHTTGPYDHGRFQTALAEIGAAADALVDADGVAGAELLRVTVPVTGTGTGTVRLRADLVAPGDVPVAVVERELAVAPGTRTATLDFAGEQLWARGTGGPYTVAIQVDDRFASSSITHRTATYPVDAFQRPRVSVDHDISPAGVDLDGSGGFDLLRVVTRVRSVDSGQVTLRGTLVGQGGEVIGTATAAATPGQAVLDFDGRAIARRAGQSAFRLLLRVVDAADTTVMAVEHTVDGYPAERFDPPPGTLPATYTDVAADGNGDGRPDRVRVTAAVAVHRPGDYTLTGALFDAAGRFITTATTTGTVTAGAGALALDFPGEDLRRHGVDGPYLLSNVVLRDNTGEVDFALAAHRTAVYPAAGFRPGGGVFLDSLTDHPVDADGSGTYDWLDVAARVVVSRPGTYAVNARLVEATGKDIGWSGDEQVLAAGTHTLTIRYDGRLINGHRVDGPYRVVDLSLYEVDSDTTATVLTEALTTAAYRWDDFAAAGLVTGHVVVRGAPLAGAVIAVPGTAYDRTDATGAYRLAVPGTGWVEVSITADPALAPWTITVNTEPAPPGTSADVHIAPGETAVVDFASGQPPTTTPPTTATPPTSSTTPTTGPSTTTTPTATTPSTTHTTTGPTSTANPTTGFPPAPSSTTTSAAPVGQARPGDPLPDTGAAVTPVAALGVWLLVGGAGLLLVGRTRRRTR
ncbi:LPXTG-motif cell wall-anchored protein [Actinokineospora baliensis]|uniref:LPXTG cell wall anchor domain-containing protein n=1 Tax=Actinokineospora baliensis TaxID=547056 RepID=UPI00195CF496|nr:LPXTG cell wall anchor domain-containing protein [Actinokineospora baliensis]MBM7773806.1 LPXTG-motif cell wall-anchored protein [Actinokineospora baliensis]